MGITAIGDPRFRLVRIEYLSCLCTSDQAQVHGIDRAVMLVSGMCSPATASGLAIKCGWKRTRGVEALWSLTTLRLILISRAGLLSWAGLAL
jgi:hypothetical protein